MLLRNQTVLVVEDEPLIAYDLFEIVEEAGGVPAGPAHTVRQALAILDSQRVSAAILDVNLRDGDVAPVAERLTAGRVPFIVQTGGILTPRLKTAFGRAPILFKPTRGDRLVQALAQEVGACATDRPYAGDHHVLLIEDEEHTCAILDGYMRRFGFGSVGHADTEQGAIEAAHRQRPDLLVVDVALREGNGLTAAAAIQAAFGTPLIVVTRTPEAVTEIDQAIVVGKPFSVSALQAAIAAAATEGKGSAPSHRPASSAL